MSVITFTISAGGKATIPKDPRARDTYGIDLTDVLPETGGVMPSVSVAEAVGVTVDGGVYIEGADAVVWVLGGTVGQDAYVTFRYDKPNGAIGYRTIYFDIRQC